MSISRRLSTIINTLAYRAIALDFEIWTNANTEIQRLHLDNFTTLLKTSRYKHFNAKQRIGKFGVLRKLLFALQTEWYSREVIPFVVSAIRIVMQTCFSVDEAVRPIISYLAANLHDGELCSVLLFFRKWLLTLCCRYDRHYFPEIGYFTYRQVKCT